MPELVVRLTIPILVERIVDVPALTFTHWLPTSDADAINVDQGNLSLRLWFDVNCLGFLDKTTEEELKKHINVIVDRAYADVTVRDLDASLLEYVRKRDFSRRPTESEQPLQDRYDEVAEQVLRLALTRFNRLVSYVRAHKGQYWLQEYEIDIGKMSSAFVSFASKARFNEHQWFRFGPAGSHSIVLKGMSRERYIAREDWAEVRNFVIGSQRTSLARALLAGAEELAAAGHSRSAITEGVTALAQGTAHVATPDGNYPLSFKETKVLGKSAADCPRPWSSQTTVGRLSSPLSSSQTFSFSPSERLSPSPISEMPPTGTPHQAWAASLGDPGHSSGFWALPRSSRLSIPLITRSTTPRAGSDPSLMVPILFGRSPTCRHLTAP
jgi:hypothetical protein